MAQLLKKSLLIATMLVAAKMGSGTASAQMDFAGTVADIVQEPHSSLAAYYDPETGDVILSYGRSIGLFSLFFIDEGFGGFGAPSPMTISSPIDPLPRLGEPGFVDSTSISYFDTRNLPPGIFNMGPILPAGAMDAESFRQLIAAGGDSGVFYQPSGGSSAPVQPFRVLSSSGVPESGSMGIFGLATVGLAARRRRC